MFDAVHLLVGHARDAHGHLGRRTLRRAEEEAVMRCHVTVIATHRQAEMVSTDVLTKRRVETEPAAVRAADLDPRVRLPLNDLLLVDGTGTAGC